VTQTYSTDVAKDRVISSTPSTGTTADRGTTVDLSVSKGAKPVKVPGVVGKTVDEARGILVGAGLKVNTTDDTTSTKDPDTVTGQNPSAGSQVKPGSTVTLKVAKAVEVPDVTDLKQADAEKQLRDAGFQVKVRTQDTADQSQDGVVLDQAPAAGEQRKRGSTVRLRVGKFTATATPTPSPSPTPTPTLTATPSP
jgi:serine/threonine-protein kinase